MKKLIAAILTIAALFATFAVPVSAAQAPEISPLYENVVSAYVTLAIDSSGGATVRVRMTGSNSLEQVNVITYLERQISGKWYRVYLGNLETEWNYTTTSSTIYQTYTAQLSTTGTYRAVSEFTVIGTTVETFTKTSQCTY